MSELKFSDVYGNDDGNWDKAWDIINVYPQCMKSLQRGETHYRVTPSVAHNVDGKEHSFALAVMMNGRKMMDTPYLVVDGHFGNLIVINQSGGAPVILSSGAELGDLNVGAVLDNIDGAVKQQKAADQARVEEIRRKATEQAQKVWQSVKANWKKFRKWYSWNAGIIGVAAIIVVVVGGVITGLVFGIGAAVDASHNNARKKDQETAAFDAAHPGMVLKGQRFGINQNGTLTHVAPDMGVNAPGQPSPYYVDKYVRSYGVTAGSCGSPRSAYNEHGTIKGNQVLVAETDAPDGIVHVKVDQAGGVTVCADDPTNAGNSLGWTVLMQTQSLN